MSPRVASDLSRENVSAMLVALRNGPSARSQLANRLGLSAGAVSRLSSRLIGAGLVELLDGQAPSSGRGRPLTPLALRSSQRVAIGVHLGASRITAGLVDLSGRVSAAREVAYADLAAPAVLRQVRDQLRRLRAAVGPDTRIIGTGIGIGGTVDQGVVLDHPHLPWQRVDLARALMAAAPEGLVVDSHVRGLALAESTFGAAREADSLVELHIGNVTDAAIVIDGELLLGPTSSAGTVAHLPVRFGPRAAPCPCGRSGCTQVELSETHLVAEAQAAGLKVDSGAALLALADEGNRTARRLVRDRTRMVGRLAGYLLDVFNPELLVLAGGITGSGDALLPQIREHAARPATGVGVRERRIVGSRLGEHPLVLAAAAPVMLSYYADPLAAEPTLAEAEGF
ncbi:ROK family transcriptional regulator [Enemella evansiae]|uniref:ROK family transcriptional regulator n=1 Tax=Enemella evansiae TaxID=2016499 RepID=UPI00106131CC|nr:ROK family transcriptional regulator [Enemella evansiae]TDO92828.1 putative NBD/HSP70 family sugar kinase [Enemella evansiae]